MVAIADRFFMSVVCILGNASVSSDVMNLALRAVLRFRSFGLPIMRVMAAGYPHHSP
jgi:hypothetical protein